MLKGNNQENLDDKFRQDIIDTKKEMYFEIKNGKIRLQTT